ncbi:MAG: succinate--CoA ligase subunit alpha [Alphaproteobacteria bacterium]|nr:succinate--CoA ligase subunit alpha [Alphaproteobacteria bacterium]
MAILINKKTKVLVQGITGTQASFHIQRAKKYGTKIVAGVVPSKKEETHLGVPLFKTVKEAKEATGANASIVFVPAKQAKSAIIEAIDANLDFVVAITSGISVVDMMEIRQRLSNSKTILIGPNTPGIITPEQAYMGIFPDNIHKKGEIGLISRSSTLTYEVVLELNKLGLGQSTIVGLGDDFIIGASFIDIIEKFNNDAKTKAIVLIAGIGGNLEIETAKRYAEIKHKKPVIALMINNPTKVLGYDTFASKIICDGITETEDKKDILRQSGIIVVDDIKSLTNELSKI